MTSITRDGGSFRDFECRNIVSDKIYELIEPQLDFTERDRLIGASTSKQDLWGVIMTSLGKHYNASFWLGWDAARNPASWLFCEDGTLTDNNPNEMFWEKLEGLGAETPDFDDANPDLSAAVLDLCISVSELSFELGFKTGLDPSWLIFQSHTLGDD